jgi:hypothetical protein
MVSMLCSPKRNHILGNGAMKINITGHAFTCGRFAGSLTYTPHGRRYSSAWGAFAYTVENSRNDRTWSLLV